MSCAQTSAKRPAERTKQGVGAVIDVLPAEVPDVQPDLARTDRAGQECRLDTNAVRRIPILFEGPTAKSVTNLRLARTPVAQQQ